ncbi:MAG: YciI family protein, partial [Polyangiaceae bacterium]|nr:YciI family protein [Polyangiaceae bacterium]
RVRFSPGKEKAVIDGPFTEAKELVAGFWLWQVRSIEEAVEWVKRVPNPDDVESEIEIRPVFEAADFSEAFTPELRAQEERLRARTAHRRS